MGFLGQEAQASLSNAIKAAASGEPPAMEAPPETPVEAPVAEKAVDSSKPAEDVKVEAESGAEAAPAAPSESDEGVESGHRVPYNRFKSVLEARNEFRDKHDGLASENERLRAQIEQLRGRPAATQASAPAQSVESPAPSDDGWIDRILAGENPEPPAAHAPSEPSSSNESLSSIEARLRHMEQMEAGRRLDLEISEAVGKYPGVDEKALYNAIAHNPGQTALQLAERFHSWQSGVEEAAIARFLEEQKKVDAETAAAPRPSATGSSQSNYMTGEKKPMNLAEAREALRAYMKKSNPFAS